MVRPVLALALIAGAALCAAAAEPAAPASIKGPGANPKPLAAADNAAYVACYFQKGSDQTWEWALNTDGSYYQVAGSYITTPLTKVQKFNAGSTAQSTMQQACANAQTKNGLLGYTLFAFFAAQSNAGGNYSIVAGGTELFPLY
ncbi:MAG TPA: hypothetical protein PLN91_03650 [Rhodanobacteraceae bacterium]|nr:hypothetical protein [Rhodanobacteraceae bacterium]